MRVEERSGIGLALAVVVLILLGVGYVSPWWSYEESTGRQNAPGGPVHDPAADRAELDFYADRWEGSTTPADPERAESAMLAIRVGTFVAVATMLLYAAGQFPFIARIITRPACMGLAAVALAGILTALVVAWLHLPGSMASKGVDGPFTAYLLEEGYIRTHLHLGWVAAALASVGAVSCGLAAYSAGDADPAVIEQYRAVEP